MTLQELLLQRFSDKESAGLQLLENFREIRDKPHRVGPFQNAKSSRERELPAQSD